MNVLNMVMKMMMMFELKRKWEERGGRGGCSQAETTTRWWSWFFSQKSPSDVSEEASVLEVDQVHVRVQQCGDIEGLSSAGLEQSSGRNTGQTRLHHIQLEVQR